MTFYPLRSPWLPSPRLPEALTGPSLGLRVVSSSNGFSCVVDLGCRLSRCCQWLNSSPFSLLPTLPRTFWLRNQICGSACSSTCCSSSLQSSSLFPEVTAQCVRASCSSNVRLRKRATGDRPKVRSRRQRNQHKHKHSTKPPYRKAGERTHKARREFTVRSESGMYNHCLSIRIPVTQFL